MEYPTLTVKPKSRDMIDLFLGYNHNLRIRENEFYDMKNMTSDYYPVLAPRKKRGGYMHFDHINGMIDKDGICFIADDTIFLSNGATVDMGLIEGLKQLISIGSYIIILPDKKWINTVKKDGADEYEWGYIEHKQEFDQVTFTLCDQHGIALPQPTSDSTPPQNPKNGDYWLDISTSTTALKKYAEDQSQWVVIPTTYVRIEAQTLGSAFNQYDGVKISGIIDQDVGDLNGYHTIWAVDSDSIIVTGIIKKNATHSTGEGEGTITISREMPIMDHVIECNNRLWGCRYGANADGEIVNEIYASKQGDFKNWYCYMQISTDSWTQGVGSDGPFTGAINYGGNPIFFKENCMHKVYGSIPANFQVQTTPCRGVQRGSHNSLAVVNETLFYKSTNAVCAYDGSLPVEVSSVFGDRRYNDAIACAYGNKYYISMREDHSGTHHLFVYDTAKGMWHQEDDLQVAGFCSCKDEIYAIDYGQYSGDFITMLGSGTPLEKKVPWMVETGLIGMAMPDMKYISKLLVRMSLEEGASVKVMIQYDSIGDWEKVCEMTATSLRSFSVPIRPRRCDHFRLHIEGLGDGRIYSITKTIEQGSDRS